MNVRIVTTAWLDLRTLLGRGIRGTMYISLGPAVAFILPFVLIVFFFIFRVSSHQRSSSRAPCLSPPLILTPSPFLPVPLSYDPIPNVCLLVSPYITFLLSAVSSPTSFVNEKAILSGQPACYSPTDLLLTHLIAPRSSHGYDFHTAIATVATTLWGHVRFAPNGILSVFFKAELVQGTCLAYSSQESETLKNIVV